MVNSKYGFNVPDERIDKACENMTATIEEEGWDIYGEPEELIYELTRTYLEMVFKERDAITADDFHVLFYIWVATGRMGHQTKLKNIMEKAKLDKSSIQAFNKLCNKGDFGWFGAGKFTFYDNLTNEILVDFTNICRAILNGDKYETIIKLIEHFAGKKYKGLQSGLLSPVFHLLRPLEFPPVNGAIKDIYKHWIDDDFSTDISEYTRIARRMSEFRDALGMIKDFHELDRLLGGWKEEDWCIKVSTILDGEINKENEMKNEKIDYITNILKIKRQIILCGPPGTSKTWLAKEIKDKLLRAGNTANKSNESIQYELPIDDIKSIEGIKKAIEEASDIELEQEARQFYIATNGNTYRIRYANRGSGYTIRKNQIDGAKDNYFMVFADLYYQSGIYVVPSIELRDFIKEYEIAHYENGGSPRYNLDLADNGKSLKFPNTDENFLLSDFKLGGQIPSELLKLWEIVQFHPSYTYEDFVRGLVAEDAEGGGSVKFVAQDKIFAVMCDRANANFKRAVENNTEPDKFVLIIDEINRADISKVFGELIYGLEYRDKPIATPYTVGDSSTLTIPPNLYIIGTMNTADKSIAMLDYALRRRFAFIPMYPDISVIEKYYDNKTERDMATNLFKKVASCFEPSARDLQVGHTYFLKTDTFEELDIEFEEYLKIRFIYEIAPLIHEYILAGEEGVNAPAIEKAYQANNIEEALEKIFNKWVEGQDYEEKDTESIEVLAVDSEEDDA